MKNKQFRFQKTFRAFANQAVDHEAIRAIFSGFTLKQVELELVPVDGFVFYTEGMEIPSLPADKEFHIVVSEAGVAVAAKDYPCLARALMALFIRIQSLDYDGVYTFGWDCFNEFDHYRIQKRMIHLCVFPETSLKMLRRLIRLAAVCQYTHICVEFWGMFKYDSFPPLAWDHAYTKDEIKPLIEEMRALGAEPIPMINSLGHATQSRVLSGKHVVLDRYPEYQYLFMPDGWAFDVTRKEVPELLKNLRAELYEVFGATEYFHIGGDEDYQSDKSYIEGSFGYLNRLCGEVIAEGRKPIIWGDMLLYPGQFTSDEVYYCLAKDQPAAERRLAALPEGTVIADWEYEVKKAPVETAVYFEKMGREVIGAPTLDGVAVEPFLGTPGLHALMLTTWHGLGKGLPKLPEIAENMGAIMPTQFADKDDENMMSGYRASLWRTEAAAIFRRVSAGIDLDYNDCGWIEKQYFWAAMDV